MKAEPITSDQDRQIKEKDFLGGDTPKTIVVIVLDLLEVHITLHAGDQHTSPSFVQHVKIKFDSDSGPRYLHCTKCVYKNN